MLNNFVRFAEKQLMLEPQRLVWAGDYADNEKPETLSLAEIKPHINESSTYWCKETLQSEGINLYSLCESTAKIVINEEVPKGKPLWDYDFKNVAPLTAKYIINHDTKEFVDKSKMPKDGDGWKLHPLPLLTAEGNGRGGGDYHSEYPNYDKVGIWSRALLEVVTRKSDIPKDYKEYNIYFIEKKLATA